MRTALLLCVIALPSLVKADPIHNVQDDFTFTVPSGYQAIKLLPAGEPFYKLGRTQAGKPAYGVLEMRAQDGVLARGPLDRAKYERKTRAELDRYRPISFEYKKTRWKGFALDVEIAHLQTEDQRAVIVATQVPLAKRCWQITLSGPETDEPSLLASLDALIASLDGKSSWR